MRDVQILTPMNRGGLGTRSLNIELQKVLNAEKPGVPKLQRFGWTYRPGDKVMQTSNDYDREVFNGDLGFIRSINEEDAEMVIDFDGRDVSFDFTDLDNLTLAYATTIHKSQGSEYPAIIMVMTMQHFPMLERNLIYTGGHAWPSSGFAGWRQAGYRKSRCRRSPAPPLDPVERKSDRGQRMSCNWVWVAGYKNMIESEEK